MRKWALDCYFKEKPNAFVGIAAYKISKLALIVFAGFEGGKTFSGRLQRVYLLLFSKNDSPLMFEFFKQTMNRYFIAYLVP